MSNVHNEVVELTQGVKSKKKTVSRYSDKDFKPIQNGFVASIPTEIPYGYNWALGYSENVNY